ncbi:MAG: hypothetical protein LBM66_03675 [Bifidobacteriaceae bacterium]|nr:hypothetical protein [Bifidobacteriaceae bacterium]
MRYYLDGTVFQCLLLGAAEAGALTDWLTVHQADVATSVLARWEAAEDVAMTDHSVRAQALAPLRGIQEIQITGRALELGSYAVAAVPAYAALTVGIAASNDQIGGVVTYNPDVASAAEVHGLVVLSPGRARDWYQS